LNNNESVIREEKEEIYKTVNLTTDGSKDDSYKPKTASNLSED